ERTNPGKPFTLAVLATLPLLSTSAKAATLGAAVKGSAMVKGATAMGLLATLLGPLLGFLGPWLQYRTVLAVAKTEAQRQSIRKYYRRLLGLMAAFGVLLTALIVVSRKHVGAHPLLFAGALIALVAAYVVAAARMGSWANQIFRALRAEQAAAGQPP